MGLPYFGWQVNCFLEGCFRPDEDHTVHFPGMAV